MRGGYDSLSIRITDVRPIPSCSAIFFLLSPFPFLYSRFTSAANLVTVGGLLAGGLAGWALSEMLVRVLKNVFDPPPAHLAVPWGYLLTVVVSSVGAIAVAVALATRTARQPAVERLREL